MKTETDFPPADESRIRATAWALGQLTPEETAAFENEMAADPELTAYAEEMRQFSSLLSAEFPATDETGQLAEASRARVTAALDQAATGSIHQGFFKRYWKSLSLTTAAAAGIILTLRPDWIARQEAMPLIAEKAPGQSQSQLFRSIDEVPFKADQQSQPSGPNGAVKENIAWASQPGATRNYAGTDPSKVTNLYSLATPESQVASAPAKEALPNLSPTNSSPPQPVQVPPTMLAASGFSFTGRGRGSGGLADGEAGSGIAQGFGKAGTGGLTLSGTNAYTGSTTVSGGTLALDGTRRRVIVPSRGSYDPTETGDFDSGIGRAPDAPYANPTTESYKNLPTNPFHEVTAAPLSTFSIDVDTASYANVRRFLNEGQRPPAAAVRLEELVNYFPYQDEPPQDGKPFAVRVETTAAPWNPAHRLARIALKGKEIATAQRPASNLVFLVDVSGSMNEPNKLPLVQQSLRMLTERLTENDRVSLVTYAGSTAVVLPSTNGQEKPRILAAIDALSSGGSTNGAGGLELAYQQAAAHFIKDGVNRVVLATDGDFNVGISSHDALLTFIETKAKTGVFLSVLGYGRGNLKDDTMELLADKGNGNYGYIDSLSEARKTLVEQMSGTLVTIAKDVKIQIEFNPAAVKSYRLLGYENRMLAKEDFNNDKKDAGEIGAGHNVTALYEIVPAGAPDAPSVPVVDGLKYQQVPAVITPKPEPTPAALTGEMMTVKLRWKQPQGDTSELLEVPVKDTVTPLDQAGQETRWSAAVAGFAQLLRGEAPPALTWDMVRQLARSAKGPDTLGYRGEFLQLIDKAEGLTR